MKKPIVSLIIVTLAILCLTGCTGHLLPKHLIDPAVIKALAADTNSVNFEILSVYGTLKYQRNIAPSGGITVTPTTTLQTTPVKP